MPFTLEDLLPDDQRLRAIQRHEPVTHAINVMHQHEFDQLPVVDADGKFVGKVVTFDSILQAVQSLRTSPELLLVRDVASSVRSYPPDEDLLTMLDDIERDNFALIVDEAGGLTGIVTTADTATFFRKYAQDLLQIEGIETRIKEAIRALYDGDGASLTTAIEAVTDRAADIRRKLPAAIKAYLGKSNIQIAATTTSRRLAPLVLRSAFRSGRFGSAEQQRDAAGQCERPGHWGDIVGVGCLHVHAEDIDGLSAGLVRDARVREHHDAQGDQYHGNHSCIHHEPPIYCFRVTVSYKARRPWMMLTRIMITAITSRT